MTTVSGLAGGYPISITAVSLCARPPVGPISIEMRPGLNVLYGKNGNGKTLLLRAIGSALSSAFQSNDTRYAENQRRKVSYVEVSGCRPGRSPIDYALSSDRTHSSEI